jgi:hypothetical protein
MAAVVVFKYEYYIKQIASMKHQTIYGIVYLHKTKKAPRNDANRQQQQWVHDVELYTITWKN